MWIIIIDFFSRFKCGFLCYVNDRSSDCDDADGNDWGSYKKDSDDGDEKDGDDDSNDDDGAVGAKIFQCLNWIWNFHSCKMTLHV